MRARLHVAATAVGFYREATHDLCDPATSGQLLDSTLDGARRGLKSLRDGKIEHGARARPERKCAGTERALLIDLEADARERGPGTGCSDRGATGVAVARGGRLVADRGEPTVHDDLEAPGGAVRVTRHVGAFFQGNRFLLQSLVDRVLIAYLPGPLVDLYAGGGLFGLAMRPRGGPVELVENDRLACRPPGQHDAAGGTASAHGVAVERFLAARRRSMADGVHRSAADGPVARGRRVLAGSKASRIVYVSCDVATLARDARKLADGRSRSTRSKIFDLFPRTAHVETLAVFDR